MIFIILFHQIYKIGISNNIEMHMDKQLSYEFLQGFELPLKLKKQLILMNSEIKRLTIIKDIFENIIDSNILQNKNMPVA